MSRCDRCSREEVLCLTPDVARAWLCIACLAIASTDLVCDQAAEIARLNAKIKRREAELLYRRERIPPRGDYAEAIQRAKNETRWARVRRPNVKRKLRIIHEANAAWTAARALRLSDPSFAGRLP